MELNNLQKQYVEKWQKYKDENGEDALIAQERRWSDWLWLGRHLAILHNKSSITSHKEIYQAAIKAQGRILMDYCEDDDFYRCFMNPKSKNGDEEWKEITNNVGSIRYVLCGRWFLDS